jgi:uncharacterized protein YigA (DUF484 family)
MTPFNDPNAIHPITEDDIVDYLANTPDFFERHAQLLAQVQLTSPHGNRAVSLQERQAQMLRDKIKALEHRVMDMVRHGTENAVTADRLHAWTCGLLASRDLRGMPTRIAGELKSIFFVAQTAIKVWDCDRTYAGEAFARGASDDAKALAASLAEPYCGLNTGFDAAAAWLEDPRAALSNAAVRSAGAGFARCPALQRRDRHAFPGTHRRTRVGRAVAAAHLMRHGPDVGERRPLESRRA